MPNDDIVTRLRDYSARGAVFATNDMCWEAAAEIERLRALIRSYADAREGIMLNWSADRKGLWHLLHAADEALLEEARRG